MIPTTFARFHIQKLIVVVGHFGQENDNEGDILFIEAIDVFKTCQNYEAFSPKSPQLPEILETHVAVDLVFKDELERCLEEKRQLNRVIKQEFMDQGLEVLIYFCGLLRVQYQNIDIVLS